MDEFTPEEIVAIAGAIKGTREKAAKDALADRSSATVDFVVRVTGSIQKGVGTLPGTGTRPAEVDLCTAPVFFALLRSLGIGAKRLTAALEQVDPLVGGDDAFADLFAQAAGAKAKKLPPVEFTTPAKAGAVSSQINLARVDA